ncbi:TPR repeat-containing protein [Microbulbifer donghaiensis]|uniref:TPR repeat-containing protein n=1 Tax=Microbulbifer donghaiensis TaxID=494016 RepID=A0A1M5FJX2_9GAMM|nr:sulfotransferase [Microbulbifer donghaiensis]SHF91796.1 TPR repeat-containing protein [Microbulbifer donghaiensis]
MLSDANDLYRSALNRFQRKDFADAITLVEQALQQDPQLVNGWRLLADSHAAQGRLERAIECLQRAQQYAAVQTNKWVSVSLHLTEILLRAGRHGEARQQLDHLPLADIQHVQPLSQAAYLYSLCEAHRESRDLFERALKLSPENPQLLFNCAAANRAMGDLARAETQYDQLIAIRHEDFEAYKNRSDLRRQSPQRNHIAELQRLSAQRDLPALGASQIQFALAKELEDLQEYGNSFAALADACRLRRSGIRYQVDKDLQRLTDIASAYDKAFMRDCRERRDGDMDAGRGEGIIFILGMPRTGTTLVDRILCAADGVFSAGEPGTFARELTAMVQAAGDGAAAGDGSVDFVQRSRQLDFAELGRRYQRELRSRPGTENARVIIDKNPMNYLYIGLIRLALPRARIVHLRRNAMDSCYAILKTQFRNAYPFSYDQSELGRYYLGYRRLMEHWQRLLPGAIFDLHYEQLVEDLAGESRRLFEYCGLPWTESVLDFHRQEKQGTATASAAQVRQPVYRSSVGKWKNYREQLQPLAEILHKGGIEIE